MPLALTMCLAGRPRPIGRRVAPHGPILADAKLVLTIQKVGMKPVCRLLAANHNANLLSAVMNQN